MYLLYTFPPSRIQSVWLSTVVVVVVVANMKSYVICIEHVSCGIRKDFCMGNTREKEQHKKKHELTIHDNHRRCIQKIHDTDYVCHNNKW